MTRKQQNPKSLTGAKSLLKFCGPTANSISNLKASVLYCQHFTAYNDPFEFWANLSEGIPDTEREPDRFVAAVKEWGFDVGSVSEAKKILELWDSVEEYFDECWDYQPPFEKLHESMRIACFGSRPDNLLMWSHYADGLRGFCISFDEELIEEAEPDGYLVDVTYLRSPPNVDSFVFAIAKDQEWYHGMAIEETETQIKHVGKEELKKWIPIYEKAGDEALQQMLGIWQSVFATKPSEWKYEQERRLLVQTDRDDAQPILRRYSRKAVKEIILGERMADDYRHELLSVLRQHFDEVPVLIARRARDHYTLTID